MATVIHSASTTFNKTEVFPDGAVCYEQEEEMPRPIRAIFVNRELVEAMGNPDTVVVTISPGGA